MAKDTRFACVRSLWRGGKKGDLAKRASLLRRDSVHGNFNGSIMVDEERKALIVNGNYIQFIYANSPADVDYSVHGIKDALVVDNTGVWRDSEGLNNHLACNGAGKRSCLLHQAKVT